MIKAQFVFKIDPLRRTNELKQGLRNKIIRIAMNKASAPVKEAVIANAPSDTGTLKKAIRIKIKNYQNKAVWVAIVGPSSSYKKTKKGKTTKPSRYAHLVEFGSKKKSPRAFLMPAYSSTRQQFLDTLQQKIGEQVDAVLRG